MFLSKFTPIIPFRDANHAMHSKATTCTRYVHHTSRSNVFPDWIVVMFCQSLIYFSENCSLTVPFFKYSPVPFQNSAESYPIPQLVSKVVLTVS